MWFKEYKDYPIDSPLKKERDLSGKSFAGCEMNELNGWGESFTTPRPRKKGFIARFLEKIFNKFD